MKIIIAATTLGTIQPMLLGWQSGKQWGILIEKEKELWKENAPGIATSATSQPVVQVYNDMTGIVYLVACLRNWRGKLTVSEVVSNPQLQLEKDSGSPAFAVFLTWVSKDSPFEDKQALGCLFSWAAKLSTAPLALTANTFGLIKLYKSYGFEPVLPLKPGVEKYLAGENYLGRAPADQKYSKIDQNMTMSLSGKSSVENKYLDGRDWTGPSSI